MKEYKIDYIDNEGDAPIQTKALFDPDIGLSVIDPNDQENPYFCWHGPLDPVWKDLNIKPPPPGKKPQLIAARLRAGVFDSDEFLRAINKTPGVYVYGECPFS